MRVAPVGQTLAHRFHRLGRATRFEIERAANVRSTLSYIRTRDRLSKSPVSVLKY